MRLSRQTFGAYLRKPLTIAALFACLISALGLGQPYDHVYWNVRYYFGQTKAPSDIVLVDTGLGESGARGQWGAAQDAALLKAIEASGADHIYFDKPLRDGANGAPARQIRSMPDRTSVVVRGAGLSSLNKRNIVFPDARLVKPSQIVVSDWYSDFVDYAIASKTRFQNGVRNYPSLASTLSGGGRGGSVREGEVMFIPDFRVDPAGVAVLDADRVLRGEALGELAGKQVIVAQDTHSNEELLGYFGHGRQRAVFLDIAGATAVRQGTTAFVGNFPFLLAALLAIVAINRVRRPAWRYPCYGALVLGVLVGPGILQEARINVVPSGAAVLLAAFGCIRGWNKWRYRTARTARSGLPNFLALSDRLVPAGLDVVVASVARYEEFLATLPTPQHAEAARQISRRFAISAGGDEIYHGEGGLFAWLQPEFSGGDLGAHFEGLRALFATPLVIGGRVFDVNTNFGVDSNGDADTPTRLNMAISSAAEAAGSGRVLARVAAHKLIDAPWELSLLARIDEAMKNGDIWLAYQPQWDYREGRISGAEALIRWDDPERGAIRPDDFILQAERAGRIDALTYWVLDQAITGAETFNSLGPRFQMSINLSAQLVDKPSLISNVSEIVRARGVDCSRLTVEVTETASLHNRLAAIRNLQLLREMGFRLSIDDYGTGESSLVYLAELPSDELKIDRHFVSRIVEHERERHIVRSTIDLAHALRQTVVAEGIEDQATFELLGRLGCDSGQGYYIGRPEAIDLLRARYLSMSETGGRLFRTC